MREYSPATALPVGIGISRLPADDIEVHDGLVGTPHAHLACSARRQAGTRFIGGLLADFVASTPPHTPRSRCAEER